MDAKSSLDDDTRAALNRSQVIDLTTTGRRTGQPRRIEIFLHHDDGRLYITGMPRADRTRDWIHNIAADPHVIVHLKQSVVQTYRRRRASSRTSTNADRSSRLPRSGGGGPTCRRCSGTAHSSC